MNEELLKELTYSPDAFIEAIIVRDLCCRILESLKPTYAEILFRCAVFEEEQQDIAEEKGVTPQAISRTYCLAVKRAREIGTRLNG
jgi:hypothetical protein